MFLEAVKPLRALLVADTVLKAALGSRWYLDLHPSGTITYPYGIIAENASGVGYGSKSTSIADMRLTVKVVGLEQAVTYALGAAIRNALNGQTVTVDLPYFAYHRVEQIGVVAFTEKEAETVFTHSGGVYRLRMSGS